MSDKTRPNSGAMALWRRLPLPVRAVVSGLVVFLVLQQGWLVFFLANTRLLPEVPWSVPLALVYLWLFFRYFNGLGPPASTAVARRAAMRARWPSPQEWRLSLLYCGVSVIFVAAIINVVYRFIEVPRGGMDLSMLPWWTLYPCLIMLSINAGVSEEAGFRGYMQGGLERRYGPLIAIGSTSVIFWLLHLNHASGMARVVLLIAYGVVLGALAWATNSIWPSILSHSVVDAISFTTVVGELGPDYFFKAPAQFSETGADAPFVVFSVLLVCAIAAGIAVLRRLKRIAPATPAGSPAASDPAPATSG